MAKIMRAIWENPTEINRSATSRIGEKLNNLWKWLCNL